MPTDMQESSGRDGAPAPAASASPPAPRVPRRPRRAFGSPGPDITDLLVAFACGAVAEFLALPVAAFAIFGGPMFLWILVPVPVLALVSWLLASVSASVHGLPRPRARLAWASGVVVLGVAGLVVGGLVLNHLGVRFPPMGLRQSALAGVPFVLAAAVLGSRRTRVAGLLATLVLAVGGGVALTSG